MSKIAYIDEVDITNKRVLLRVDFNVSLTEKITIADDARIKQSLPTIDFLLKKKNKLILVSHLGRPKGKDPNLSLKIVVDHLQKLIPGYETVLIDDFLNPTDQSVIKNQKQNQIIILENIRFYPEEKNNEPEFAKKLASLAEIFVNDAFGVAHRQDASVVGVAKLLPSYGGLLLKKEVTMISKVIENPQKPFVVILGGAKVSTKIGLISKLAELADYLLIGGGLANTFVRSQGYNIGSSFCEEEVINQARNLLNLIKEKKTSLVLPVDAVVSQQKDSQETQVVKINNVAENFSIFDIGPETQALFGSFISKAKTIIWNGPVGYFENPAFRRGTDFIYYSIAQNQQAVSIVGGGDTLAALSKKDQLDKITHISTGGGAMLEFIEKGTLPGIEALKK